LFSLALLLSPSVTSLINLQQYTSEKVEIWGKEMKDATNFSENIAQ
jgi:hypothetical protein